MLKLEYLFRVI